GPWQLHGLAQMRPLDGAAAPATPHVNPSVSPPLRCIDAAFKFTRWKATEQNVARLGLPVPISIREEHNVRGAGHDEATPGGHETVNGWQICCPDSRGIHPTVAVRVTQQFYDAERARLCCLLEFLIGV